MADSGARSPEDLRHGVRSGIGATVLWFAAALAALTASRLPAVDAVVAASRAVSGGDTGDGDSAADSISPDGRFLVLSGFADDLVEGQSPSSAGQLFHFDRVSKWSVLISHAAGVDSQPANGSSNNGFMSADGRYVAWDTEATDVAGGVTDTNSQTDVYLWDRTAGESILVSYSDSSDFVTGNGGSFVHGISADGRFVLYRSAATDLPGVTSDANGGTDFLLYDRTGTTRLVTHAAGASETATANQGAVRASLSDDGNWVVFTSPATNVVTGITDANGENDVFLWERAAPVSTSTRLVSRSKTSATTTSNGFCNNVTIAPDGSWVGFRSEGSNVEGTTSDANATADVFQYDRTGNVVRLVSHSAGNLTVTGAAEAGDHLANAGGSFVAFLSRSNNHVAGQIDASGNQDLFVWTRSGGAIALVSHALGAPTQAANNETETFDFAADGSRVAFESRATNLIAGLTDTNGSGDIFTWDRVGGVKRLVSHAAGTPLVAAAGATSGEPRISASGAYTAFYSGATNLVAVDGNDLNDAFYSGPLELFTDGFERGTPDAWSTDAP